MEDKGWISPPESICSSSSGSDITSTEASFPDSLNDSTENKELLSQDSNSRNPTDHIHSTPISQTDAVEISPSNLSEFKAMEPNANDEGSVELRVDEITERCKDVASQGDSVIFPTETRNPSNDNSEKFEGEAGSISSNKDNDTEHREAPDPNLNASSRVGRGMCQVHYCNNSFFSLLYILLISL